MSPRDQDPIPPGRFAQVNIVEALSKAQHLPAEALDLAVAAPARVAGPILAVVERAASGETLSERDANLLFWGIHVLGQARDTRLCAPLLRLLAGPADTVSELVGDVAVTTLPRIVCSTFDGDGAALEAVLLDPDGDEFIRYGLFGAWAFMVAEGRIGSAHARDLLVRFDAERPARAGNAAWTGWEQAIALLGLADLAPLVDRARQDARLLDDVSDPAWFAATLADAQGRPGDRARFDDLMLGELADVVAELDEALSGEEEAEPVEPVRNPLRHVGRNDPCPCDSGKKYKACCLVA